MVVSKNGHTETHKNGDRFVVLENGRRYDGEPGQPDFRIMEFERYGVKIQSQPGGQHARHRRARPRHTLLAQSDQVTILPNSRGARAAAYRNQSDAARHSALASEPAAQRTINLVMAVLIYLTYSNLLNVVQSWIEQGKMSFGRSGSWTSACLVAALVAFIFWLRVRNRPLFTQGHVQPLAGSLIMMRIYEEVLRASGLPRVHLHSVRVFGPVLLLRPDQRTELGRSRQL